MVETQSAETTPASHWHRELNLLFTYKKTGALYKVSQCLLRFEELKGGSCFDGDLPKNTSKTLEGLSISKSKFY